jgi:hypothetical protein
LTNKELSFFDDKLDIVIKAVLPQTNATPEKERTKRLGIQDKIEQIHNEEEKNSDADKEDDELARELRRSIKMVEAMGRIIKNRAGSLEKTKLESVFEEAMKVHLRILTSFFEFIKNEKEQRGIVDFISNRLNKIIEDKARKPSQEKLEKISITIFWNMNFFVVYGFINKIIHSLGSDKLTEIIKKVCDNENSPVSFLVKHGILMWYNKNLQIGNIAKRIDEDGFSEIAKKIMKFSVINHCSMHSMGFKEKQKIEHKLGIPSKKLLIEGFKKDKQ